MLKRSLPIAASLVGSTVVGLYFAPSLFRLLVRELPAGRKLILVEMTDLSAAYFKLAFIAGLGLALPLVLIQVRRLVLPSALTGRRRLLAVTLPLAILSYYGGVAVGLAVILPFVVAHSFGPIEERATVDVSSYVKLATTVVFLVGSIAAMPAILIALGRPSE